MLEQRADLVHRGLQHVRDAVHRDPLGGIAAARRMVDDDGDRRVGQIELARERRLGHSGHPDQRRAVALQPVDLGRGLEPRPGDGGVDAAVGERDPGGRAPRRGTRPRSAGRVRMREVDVDHAAGRRRRRTCFARSCV